VADIRCGVGGLLSLLREDGWSPVGIEDEKPCADYARTQFGLDILDGSFEPGRVPENTFDLIVLSHVIEHVPDPIALIKSSAALLRHGGRIYIEVPNLLMPYGCPDHFCPSFHLYTFSPGTLQDVLLRSGLSIVKIDVDSCWIKVLAERTPDADSILLRFAEQQIKACLGRLSFKEHSVDEMVECLGHCSADAQRLQKAIDCFTTELGEAWAEFQQRHQNLLDSVKQETVSPASLDQMFRGLFFCITRFEKTLGMRDWAPIALAEIAKTTAHFTHLQAHETDINRRCQYEVQKYIQLRGILSKAVAETNQRLKQIQFKIKLAS